jgi:hypothetical protein
MRSRLARRRAGAAAVALTLLLTVAGAAVAATKIKLSAVKLTRTHASAMAMGRAIMANPKLLKGAIFVISPANNSPRVLVTAPHESVAGFPRDHHNFALLSTGCGLRFDQVKYKGSSGCNDAGPVFRGTRDTTMLRLTVTVPKGASCLSFRFRFLSNEYPLWVGSQYNDAFIAELDHSTWSSTVKSPAISAPNDFAKTIDGHLITINATGVGKVSKANAKGTGYDAATRILRASTKVKPGRHFVYLSIFDQGDREYDSTVFIDDLAIDHRAPCTRGIAFDQH